MHTRLPQRVRRSVPPPSGARGGLAFRFDRCDELADFVFLGIGQILLRALGVHVQQIEHGSAGDDVVHDARTTTPVKTEAPSVNLC